MHPRKRAHQMTERGLMPVYATGEVRQTRALYDARDHAVWTVLQARQRAALETRACAAWRAGLAALGLESPRIPSFARLNRILKPATGWRLAAVEGLLPDAEFFDLLARRVFPVTWWIRAPEQLDYIAEPDLFHDLFGHVPLLMHPDYAAVLEAFGRAGAAARTAAQRRLVARQYWFTVEFSLVAEVDGPRILGAGLLSSPGESRFSLESPRPARLPYDFDRVTATGFRIDDYQRRYFVLRDLAELRAVAVRLAPESGVNRAA